MKVLVTGAKGQLGTDVISELKKRNIPFIATGRDELDITDPLVTFDFISVQKPDAVIHCAAYTAVDRAEDDEKTCRMVNADGTTNIATACEKIGAKLIYISTDYVFSGEGDEPFKTDSFKSPLNVYGRTKLDGENNALRLCSRLFIVRTSWVFGHNGSNFVKTMLNLGLTKDSLTVVCDQIGSPTYTKDLAALLCDMVLTEKYGLYHATNEGFCSWAEFASEIMQIGKRKCDIIPVTTAEYKQSRAKRPLNSRLSKKSLDDAGFNRLPDWRDALSRFIEEITADIIV